MSTLELRTFQESYELARSLIRNYVDQADVSPGSDYDLTARVLAAMFQGNQAQAEFVADQIYPDTSSGEYLERHAARVGGRLPATKASLTAQATAPSGTDTIPSGTALTHSSGQSYKTTSAAVIALPAWTAKTVVVGSNRYRVFLSPDVSSMNVGDIVDINGEERMIQATNATVNCVDLWEPLSKDPSPGDTASPVRGALLQIQADETGPEGNQIQGDTLTITSPPGVVDAATRIVTASGGADLEKDDDLKARIAAHDEQPPGTGNVAHYRALARQATDYRVADAVVYPGFRGFGTIDVIPLGPSGARFPTATMATIVDAIIADEAPYVDDVLVLTPTLSAYKEVTMTVYIETGNEADFENLTGYAVLTGSSASRLQLDSNPVGTIEVGDRILYSARFGGIWQVYERKVTAVANSYLDLDTALPFTPSTNPDGRNDVFSSGPLGLSVVAAIEGVFDALGPGVGPLTQFERHPSPADEWDPVLRLNALRCAVTSLDGVRDVTINTVDDTTPADITPAAQQIVRQGQLTVKFDKE